MKPQRKRETLYGRVYGVTSDGAGTQRVLLFLFVETASGEERSRNRRWSIQKPLAYPNGGKSSIES